MRKVCLFVLGALLVALLPSLPAQSTGASLGANPQPIWQTNADVRILAVSGGKVYAGGRFTTVRPPGSAPGTNEVSRTYLARFDALTGALDMGFNPVLNDAVYSIAASADGSRIFVGGDFTTVNGQSRRKLAAFDAATGALSSQWRPSASWRVKAIEVRDNTVWLGGSFSLVNNVERLRLAAVTADTATLLPWAPEPNNEVYALALSDDGSKLYAGGPFTNIDGTPANTVASLNPGTGALQPFPAASAIPQPSGSCISRVRDITTHGNQVFFANSGDGGGCFDGTFAAAVDTGALLWKNNCLGATEAIEYVNGWLYKGSHAHDCANLGGGNFPQGAGYRFLLAQDINTGAIGPWTPNTDAGPPTEVGPLAMATDGGNLWVGGDFNLVNGGGQQGITRFISTGPGAAPAKPAAPKVFSPKPGEVKINVQTVYDADDTTLTYKLYRGFNKELIHTWTGFAEWWRKEQLTYTDAGLPVGSDQIYRVEVTDGANTVLSNYSAHIIVSGTTANYTGQVIADNPTNLYWRLGDASGSTSAADSSGSGNTGASSNVTYNQPGRTADGNRAATFSSSGRINGSKVSNSDAAFSVEAWVRTSSLLGGRILGFGNSLAGTSSMSDRMLYVDSNNRVRFGVRSGGIKTIGSPGSIANGQWHHVVGTFEPGSMKLYVDGALVATGVTPGIADIYRGYWRAGTDSLNGWPNRPLSAGLSGTLDELAVYPFALTAQQVLTHYQTS
ncbi:LamG domain-containing protein [Kribbella deserti]|uniref:LamG domain-containing protein n=1 Tax=Kribbella deserti TaxID=1926257 RepID=A0ABV6QIK1_9ACTN